jgi:hypothetical protein
MELPRINNEQSSNTTTTTLTCIERYAIKNTCVNMFNIKNKLDSNMHSTI